MSRGNSTDDVLSKIDWVKRLPVTGWSTSIIESADSISSEINELLKQKMTIDEKIRSRFRVLRSIPGRATREAELMYSLDDIIDAKKEVTSVD